MAFWGISNYYTQSNWKFYYSNFQITYHIITVLITLVRSGVFSIVYNVGSDVNNKKNHKYLY